MAIITAAGGGGNWNSTSTWVGGVIPGAADDVIINASSGAVTVTDARSCLTINFTNHTNTFTINSGFALTVGTTITLSSSVGFSVAGAGRFQSLGSTAAFTINFNGVTIPNLQLGFTAGASVQTVTVSGSNPTVQNLTITNGGGVGATLLAGPALTITNSLNVTDGTITGLGGVAFNIGGGGIVDVTTSRRIGGGFTVLTGTTLRMQSSLLISGGTITFNSGSFLIHNNNTLFIGISSITLNSPNIDWYNVTFDPGGNSTALNLLSDLSILNNFTTSISVINNVVGSGGTRNINIVGSFSMQSSGAELVMTNTIVNLIGTGILDAASGYRITGTTININTSNPSGYTIGSSTRNFLSLDNCTLNLVSTSIATVNTGHLLRINGSSSTLSTNNTITGANVALGSQIIWSNLIITGGATAILILSYDTIFTGNLTTGTTNFATINTGKLLLQGNFSPSTGNSIGGTSTIEFSGSNNQNCNSTIPVQNNITINKSEGSVTITAALTWGAAGRTFNIITGNNLILSANLTITAGTITFLGTATLTPNLNTLFLTTVGAKTLNTGTVNWYNVNNNTLTTLVILSSSLNISNNLNFTNTFGSAGCGFSGSFNTFVSGSLIATDAGTPSITYPGGGSINMVGAGTIESTNVMAFTLNINTPNPSGYVFGSVARPTYFLGNPGVINLVTSSIATVFSSSHNLNLRVGSTVNTNNTPTGANLPGGTQILWGNITSTVIGTQTTTISQPIIAQGNLTATTVGVIFVVNGAKVTVGGNLNCINLQGTSEIELGQNTNGTWSAGTYQNNITVNKSSPGSLTLSGAITWGLANRVLTRTAGSINPSTSTISIPASTNVTINDMTLWNLTIPGASTTTHNISNTIQSNLTLAATGNTVFTGSAGWTCANLLCSTANRIITLANSSSGASYRTTTNANLLGTAASPISMSSNNATTRSLWTLDNGAQQSLTYVNGTRIDSSQGATVWSFGGLLTNTVNWGSGSAPATTAYTYVC
jgi:hypothetical protein